MRTTRAVKAFTALSLAGLLVAACGGDDDDDAASTTAPAAETTAAAADTTAAPGTTSGGSTAPSTGGLKVDVANCTAPSGADVKLQLQWFTQAQFGGYFAAVEQGFYEDEGLNVEIVEGGVEIQPQKTLASGAVDFAISWVPKALAEREAGAKVTNIAQIFQRSGTLQVSFKDAGITSAADFAGKKIGNWGFGNEYEIFAALAKAGLDPASDVTLIQQNFDMAGLLAGDIDAAEAMTYNEYAQVLEAVNPDTGELYTADDLNVVSYEEEGVGMLQDAIWADEARLSDPAYCGEALAFVKGSIKGWAYCRDNVDACRDIVVAKGSTLGATHQLWQMNEINKLIWPAEGGVGYIDPDAYARTIEIASGTPNLDGATVLTKAPDDTAWTNDIVTAALQQLGDEGVDVNGSSYAPIEVTLTEGGA
ncbi:MAG: ABC transporter substrate-binding protein [Ilumatobacteraceae bacterium]